MNNAPWFLVLRLFVTVEEQLDAGVFVLATPVFFLVMAHLLSMNGAMRFE